MCVTDTAIDQLSDPELIAERRRLHDHLSEENVSTDEELRERYRAVEAEVSRRMRGAAAWRATHR
jgi:post-segregation antitoxin (ccd killing protein)